jgi:hypothetical protein
MCAIFENVKLCSIEGETVLKEMFRIVKVCIRGLWKLTLRNATQVQKFKYPPKILRRENLPRHQCYRSAVPPLVYLKR